MVKRPRPSQVEEFAEANYRTQDGFGVNTCRMANAAGEGVLVKCHWKSQQGIESLTEEQAPAIQATELDFDPLDDAKTWPEDVSHCARSG